MSISEVAGVTVGTLHDVLNPTARLTERWVCDSGEAGPDEPFAAIAAAKGELVEALPDADSGGLAVLNADDELVAAMASRTTARVLLYGRCEDAAVQARDVEMGADGRAHFTLCAGGESAPVSLRVLGRHQVSNALGAAAVAWGLGMTIPAIAAALSDAQPRAGMDPWDAGTLRWKT